MNLDATTDNNIFLSNFFTFIRILKFGTFSISQEFSSLIASITYLPAVLYYRSSYIKNKDDIGLLTI